ncbi:hypothetical protein ILYODFUR_035760 [Ilyodon furcidens]|uniref:IF rod domain-containing protein n=1 Tax=Ilyodon furcidens TaxID=33524 RepID=A0ABV0VJU8_9TELE
MKASLEQLQIKYTVLLELKPRLESEIAEYRRLLEGEAYEQKKAVIIKQVTEEVESKNPNLSPCNQENVFSFCISLTFCVFCRAKTPHRKESKDHRGATC